MKQSFIVELGPGRPKSLDVKRAIIPSLEELKMANPSVISNKISVLMGRRVSRMTVFKYLEELVEEKQIKKCVISKGVRKTISIYSL